jgi:GxxExxY protein
MHADTRRYETDKVTEGIVGCAYKVCNTLGCGFVEKVYENALVVELKKSGLKVEQQRNVNVLYDGVVVGEFAADLLVEDRVIVELNAAKALDEVHVAQCLNYLKASGLHVGLLLNFGRPRLELKRIVDRF